MNLKNMRRLRAHLRSRKNLVGFNMAKYFRHNGRDLVTPAAICRAVEKHPCGTVACIGGHAAILAWQSGNVPKSHSKSTSEVAAKWLGLDDYEANSLFFGHWPNRPRGLLHYITKPQAITELTRLIKAEQAA